MVRWLLSLSILAILATSPVCSQDTKEEAKPQKGLVKGENLPGPFHPYNVNGPRAGRYHCLVTQTSLDPVVMIVVRDLDYTDSLKALEAELDNRIAKNPNVRLSSFTVFLSEDLAKVAEDDDKRDQLADDLRDKAKDLKHVVFCLASKTDLENYALADDAWATIVLVNKYKVVTLHTLTKEKLNAEKVAEIVGEVSEQLGAKRK